MDVAYNKHETQSLEPGYKVKQVDIIDGLILHYICKPLAPILKSTNHTANLISIYGSIFTLGGMWYLWKDDMLRFSIYFWIAYVLDCMDGYFARRYNMVTKGGDIFEHVRDLVSLLGTFLICCWSYVITKPVVFITIVSSILTGIHVGCVQERFVERSYGETLDILKSLCVNKTISDISMCYGVGMYMLSIYMTILYLSGGLWLYVKMFFLVTIALYFTGMHLKNRSPFVHMEDNEPLDNIQIPGYLIPDDEELEEEKEDNEDSLDTSNA